MNKHLIKTLAFGAFAISAFANSNQAQMSKDPNPCARWGTSSSSNFYASLEAVFFKPLGILFGQSKEYPDPQVASLTYQQETYFKNEFTPGVRALIGYNTPFDGWDLNLIYTGFNYHQKNAYLRNTNYGHQTLTYYYNQGDLDLGRVCKVSRKLKIRPHFGVRGLALVQKLSQSSTNSPPTEVFQQQTKLNGRLIGAEAGFDTYWKISREFTAYANFTLATLVNSSKYRYLSDTFNLKTNYETRIVNGYEYYLGLRWDRNISDNNYHVAINFGYEQHTYVNLNSYASWIYNDKFSQDFAFQGIALGLRFDF